MPFLDRLVDHAIAYYRDFVRPEKRYRHPTDLERAALADLAETLRAWTAGADAEAIQTIVYEVGKRHPFPELRAWFGCLYQVLLGQQEGPRFGGFIALYGIDGNDRADRGRAVAPGRRRLTRCSAQRARASAGPACASCRRSSACCC